MSKQFWAILAIIGIGFIGIIIFSNSKDEDSKVTGTPTSHITGSASTGVKLVEYGDFQCPACGAFYPSVEQVVEKYKDQIQFQFRNLPLTSLHPNAFAAARAGEAASLQGKFFEMYSLLYENQSDWQAATTPLTNFTQFASSLQLNTTQFKTDFASSKANNAINADLAAFAKTGADKATPSFFLDGKQISTNQLIDASGQPSVDAFSKLIDKAIAAKKQ